MADHEWSKQLDRCADNSPACPVCKLKGACVARKESAK